MSEIWGNEDSRRGRRQKIWRQNGNNEIIGGGVDIEKLVVMLGKRRWLRRENRYGSVHYVQ